jgi:hypothetical protein
MKTTLTSIRPFSVRSAVAALLVLTLATCAWRGAISTEASSPPVALHDSAPGHSEDKHLLGSWTATVTAIFEGSPEPWVYPELLTFSPGGGVVVTFPLPSGSLFFSSGHGNWTRTGRNTYMFTYHGYVSDSAGNYLGIYKTRGTLRLNREQNGWLAEFQSVQPFPGAGTIEATRIEIEPMQ